MSKVMRNAVGLLISALFTNIAPSQRNPYIHKFQYWGSITTPELKVSALVGFTNGFFFARESFGSVYSCLDTKVSYDQAIAMIDKFYKTNPQQWNLTLANGILLALTVKDGPCPETLTFTDPH